MEKFNELEKNIRQFAQSIGINKIGFASAEPFLELRSELIIRSAEQRSSKLAKGSLDERTTPSLLLSSAQSLISIAIAYPRQTTKLPRQTPKYPYGYFSRSSWGRDYHFVVGDLLARLKAYILEQVNDAEVVTMVDTGVLSDRSVALRAGIGYIGKNGSIITPEFGSYVYLGTLVTNLKLTADIPLESECGSCEKCIKACPVSALYKDYSIHEKRCLSYVTQAKHSQPKELLTRIYDNIYGCDICQEVCPKNRGVDSHFHSECEATGVEAIPIISALQMTNKEFKLTYGHLAGSWRGLGVIKRNAIFVARYFKYREALPYIEALASDSPLDYVKEAAAFVAEEFRMLKK